MSNLRAAASVISVRIQPTATRYTTIPVTMASYLSCLNSDFDVVKNKVGLFDEFIQLQLVVGGG